MTQVTILVAVLVITALVDETKTDPSTLKAILNEEYYLGSGADHSKHSPNNQDKELDFTEEENKIVQDVFSPDYYEPNIILDFRYMKSGGRGYARSDGGQVLILPKRHHMPSLYNNYDTLIEFLRLKNLEEENRHLLFEADNHKHHQQNFRSDHQHSRSDHQHSRSDHQHSRSEAEKEHAEHHKKHSSEAERGWAKYKN